MNYRELQKACEYSNVKRARMGGYPCLEHREDGGTLMVGKYGAIYEIGIDGYRVIFSNYRIARKNGFPEANKGDEMLRDINILELKKYMEIIKVPKHRASQQKWYLKNFTMEAFA